MKCWQVVPSEILPNPNQYLTIAVTREVSVNVYKVVEDLRSSVK